MRKILIPFVFILLILTTQCKKKEESEPVRPENNTEMVNRVFSLAQKQYKTLIRKIDTIKPLRQPRSLQKDGSLKMVIKEDWTSGFFPGSLWYIYEYTKDNYWKKKAEMFTEALDSAQFVTSNHDVGFMIQNSFGNGYRLTGNKKYKQAVIEAARSLSTRYRPIAGIIQSWDGDSPWLKERGWDMPVIIDNMMNLNLLYKASKHTGDTSFANKANNHGRTTIKNHYRKDYSCYHVVDYDHLTGKVRSKVNYQGYADNSSWARGQAWGLYGFTEIYRETGNKEFLNQAIHIAEYIINNKKIPADRIPYWDYDAPDIPNAPRDASAAAITASALIELSGFSPEKEEKMLAYAIETLKELSSEDYLAKEGENGGFLLKHSVGNYHENNETDTPLNYADYYFLEALLRWKNIK
jgi:rhamnogalacturonyl hydrolase YesR